MLVGLHYAHTECEPTDVLHSYPQSVPFTWCYTALGKVCLSSAIRKAGFLTHHRY